jgi:hypothetical protein
MTPDATLLVVYALCVFRLTRLVTTDTISDSLREAIRQLATGTFIRWKRHGAVAYAETRETLRGPWSAVFSIVTCDWCSSVWISAGCACGWIYGRSWFNFVAIVFALSAVAGVLRERVA